MRKAVNGDRNFILATWLRGLYYGDSFYREVNKDTFMKHYHGVVEAILAQPGTEIIVACLKEDPEVILGYAVGRKVEGLKVLDYLFVKSAWRNIGIAKSLVPVELDACTHLTKVGRIIKPASCAFNPFLIPKG